MFGAFRQKLYIYRIYEMVETRSRTQGGGGSSVRDKGRISPYEPLLR